jgi:hypothetical protein
MHVKADRSTVRLLQIVALFVLLLGLLKGAAFPHHWAATHLLFDYDQGFVKRALLGSLIKATGIEPLRSYAFSFGFNVAVLLANLALMVAAFGRMHRSAYRELRFVPIVYASSLAVPYLANSIGYFDHLGLLAALVALRIDAFWKRFVFLVFAFAVLPFIHEATFLVFVPVCLFSLAVEVGRNGRRIGALVALGVLVTLLTHFVADATISRAAAMQMYAEANAAADFLVDRTAFDVLHRSSGANLDIMARAWAHAKHWREVGYSLVATVPTCAVLLYLGWRVQRRLGRGRGWRILGCAAGLSPLALHAFGWDIHRWNTLAVTACFLLLCPLAGRAPVVELEEADAPGAFAMPSARVLALLFCLFTLNTSSTIGFLNGRRVEPFPFRSHVRYWVRVAAGIDELPARPLAPAKLDKKLPVAPVARFRWPPRR